MRICLSFMSDISVMRSLSCSRRTEPVVKCEFTWKWTSWTFKLSTTSNTTDNSGLWEMYWWLISVCLGLNSQAVFFSLIIHRNYWWIPAFRVLRWSVLLIFFVSLNDSVFLNIIHDLKYKFYFFNGNRMLNIGGIFNPVFNFIYLLLDFFILFIHLYI